MIKRRLFQLWLNLAAIFALQIFKRAQSVATFINVDSTRRICRVSTNLCRASMPESGASQRFLNRFKRIDGTMVYIHMHPIRPKNSQERRGIRKNNPVQLWRISAMSNAREKHSEKIPPAYFQAARAFKNLWQVSKYQFNSQSKSTAPSVFFFLFFPHFILGCCFRNQLIANPPQNPRGTALSLKLHDVTQEGDYRWREERPRQR